MTLHQKLLTALLLLILLCTCGVSKNNSPDTYDTAEAISVKTFGAQGDGRTDDTDAIQRAFDRAESVYFPRGDYRIASGKNLVHNPACIRITDASKARKVTFAEGARLYIDGNFKHDFKNFVVFKVFAQNADINRLTIEGLTIFAEPGIKEEVLGFKAIEHQGHHIHDLRIDRAALTNLTSAAIITYAKKTTLTNIRTENTGRHGIGARNPYNLGVPHELYIDGYESYNDKAYSIDFSGSQIGRDPSTANPEDSWTGVVKNVKSVNSLRGIKTAGHWNLLLENIEVIRPKVYGFFINKHAPNHRITIKNMLVQGAGQAGMSLNGRTNVDMENVRLIGCRDGLLVHASYVNIDGLTVDGLGRGEKGIRIPSDATITNFSVTGITDDYPIWITRGKVNLSNGKIYNNNGTSSILIHKNAGEVTLDNLEFYDDRPSPKQVNGVVVMKENEGVTLKKIDTSRLRGARVVNKSKVRIKDIE